MALVEIKNLTFTYNGAAEPALQNVDLTVERGDFVLLCGESGCGKTTLLRLLKKQLRPAGRQEGLVTYDGVATDRMDEREAAARIGFVLQRPENQTVTDRVWHELAFGLESLGERPEVIRRRVAEICGFFGIGAWYHSRISELSGGQKQLLSLAAVMVMEPELLILDEPTAQLDPIAAAELLTALRRINEELGVTVILSEHRLEEVFPMASRVALMERARLVLCEAPRAVGERLTAEGTHRLRAGLPAAVRLFAELGGTGECPLTVREGKQYLCAHYRCTRTRLEPPVPAGTARPALELNDAYFRYGRDLPDVLSGLSLTVREGEMLCVLGANGSGKTTLLRVLAGACRLYRGKYRVWGKSVRAHAEKALYRGNLALLPQSPQDLFVGDTLLEDLLDTARLTEPAENAEQAAREIAARLELSHLLARHPFDLSGGELQRTALAKLLLLKPRILLLDEPTKGLDAYAREQLAALLHALRQEGRTVVVVTHDVEFAAAYADRCAMFFDGQIVSCADRVSFFAENRYYTTAAARMTRPMLENAVTVEMAAALCRQNGRLDE